MLRAHSIGMSRYAQAKIIEIYIAVPPLKHAEVMNKSTAPLAYCKQQTEIEKMKYGACQECNQVNSHTMPTILARAVNNKMT